MKIGVILPELKALDGDFDAPIVQFIALSEHHDLVTLAAKLSVYSLTSA